MKPFRSIQKSLSLFKSITIPLVFLVAAGLSHGAVTYNLLVDPGYETQASLPSYSTVASDFPSNQGLWGAPEDGYFTGAEFFVTPKGLRMLAMPGYGSIANKTIQITSLAAYGSAINAGNAIFDLRTEFNSAPEFGAPVAAIAVMFFANDWNSQIGSSASNQFQMDASPGTWELISVSGIIPAGAAWIGTEVSFSTDTFGEYLGFVDSCGGTITVIPETSTATLGLVAAGLLLRRKRQARRAD